tara:strand:+ start:869 stop:1096 length:228 start_codon:yes stop_codon:yes gene_type:complete
MPQKSLILISSIEMVFPAVVAALVGYVGGPFISAVVIGFATKLLLYIFDLQVKMFADFIKKILKKGIKSVKKLKK